MTQQEYLNKKIKKLEKENAELKLRLANRKEPSVSSAPPSLAVEKISDIANLVYHYECTKCGSLFWDSEAHFVVVLCSKCKGE